MSKLKQFDRLSKIYTGKGYNRYYYGKEVQVLPF